MKIRLGFVSNSSSASFIVIWKNYSCDEDDLYIKKSLAYLFDITIFEKEHEVFTNLYFDEKESSFIKNKKEVYYEQFKLTKEDMENLVEITEVRPDGSLSTEFFTSMFNDFSSFGPSFIKFCGSLFAKNGDGNIVVFNKKFEDKN